MNQKPAKPAWVTALMMVGSQLAVIVVETLLHSVVASFSILLLSFLVIVTMPLWLARVLPATQWQGLRRWQRGVATGALTVVGLTVWSVTSSLLTRGKPPELPAGVLVNQASTDILEEAASHHAKIHKSNYHDIVILGHPQVGKDAHGVQHALLAFRWTAFDRGLMAVLGERTYAGMVYLRAEPRLTTGAGSASEPFQMVDYSAKPTKGNGAYLIGWFDVWNLMREADFITNWVTDTLAKAPQHR